MGVYNGVETHGIVKAGFDMSGSMRSGTVEICDTDGDRLDAAFKVRTYRSSKYTELVFISRFYTDNGIGTKHIGAYI